MCRLIGRLIAGPHVRHILKMWKKIEASGEILTCLDLLEFWFKSYAFLWHFQFKVAQIRGVLQISPSPLFETLRAALNIFGFYTGK